MRKQRLRRTSAVRPSPMRTLIAPGSSRVSVAVSPDIGGRNATSTLRASPGTEHAFRRSAFAHPQRAAIERLLVRVVELEPARPRAATVDTFHDDLDANVVRLNELFGLPLAKSHGPVPRMKFVPQQIRCREQVSQLGRGGFTPRRPDVRVVVAPPRHSFQRLRPMSHNASACIAEVLPELFGPMKTTGLPSSTSTSSKRLKLRMVRFVSTAPPPRRSAPLRHRHIVAGSLCCSRSRFPLEGADADQRRSPSGYGASPATSTRRASALARRIWRGVRQRARSRPGLATTTARHWARLVATFRRLRL